MNSLINLFIEKKGFQTRSMLSKNKTIKIVITVLIIAVVVIIPKLTFLKGSSEEKGRSRRDSVKELTVDVIILKSAEFSEKILSTGTIWANEEVELRSEVSGRVTGIFFTEGNYVQKGELLVKINDAELQAQMKKAESRRKILEDREYRQRILLEKSGTTQENYDAALNELQSLDADIELLKAQIEKTEIKAPFDGYVGLRYISEGSYITPSTKIALFQKTDKVKIDFAIPGKYYSYIKKGNNVKLKIPGSVRVFDASVFAIEPKIDEESRSVIVRAIANNAGRVIPPGAFANVEVKISEKVETFSVPTESVIPDISGQVVYLYKNGTAVPQTIEILDRDVKTVRIASGVHEKDTVIVSGIINLRPGLTVKVSGIK